MISSFVLVGQVGYIKKLENGLYSIFDSIDGEVVQTTAFATTNVACDADRVGVYLRLVDGRDEAEKAQLLCEAAANNDHAVRFETSVATLAIIPGRPIVYWASQQMLNAFVAGTPLGKIADPHSGLCTGNNSLFIRQWFEISSNRSYFMASDRSDAVTSGAKWFPYNKGGEYRRWFGNQSLVVNWCNDGADYARYVDEHPGCGTRVQGSDYYFRPCVSWSNVSSGEPSFRLYDSSSIFSHVGQALFPSEDERLKILGFANSGVVGRILETIAPGTH